MFIRNNNGFLLEDALISVMIVTVMSTIVCASVLSHYHIEESVEKECLESKENTMYSMQEIEVCELCMPTSEENAEETTEPY